MKHEAVLLADCAHAKFIRDVMADQFPTMRLLALTADAHGAALKFGAGNVLAPYDFTDYQASLKEDVALTARLSQEWLAELGLGVTIEGVNLAELDGLNQFLFFHHGMHIARTAAAMIGTLPPETVLRVPVGATLLAADFYLDSDIAAAIIRHVGETMGYRVEPLHMERRPLHFAAWTDRRPFLNDRVQAAVFRRESPASAHRRRIGFVPSVVSGITDYFVAFNALPEHEVIIFDSPWAERPQGPALDGIDPDDSWLDTARTMLDQYRQAFWHRIERSCLPGYLRDNPYLRFQFDYILTNRWFAYARYIYSAAHFVRDNPLDLFIYCDHFIAEGAILAALYRRSGTKTAVATHALHACDAPFVAWHPSDTAIVRSTFAARQALQKGGLAAAYVVTAARPESRPTAGGTIKRILFLGNAVEAPMPAMDVSRYLEVITALGAIPAHLSGKVGLTSRLKPGVFSEYQEVHCQSCGWAADSFERPGASSLEDSIASADLVVGAGIPTSAYLEVLAQGKPLVHVGLEPYFPASANSFASEIEGCVIGPDRLWPEIEALLFDQAYRSRRLTAQRRWYESDIEPSFPEAANPLAAVLEAILARAG